MSHKAEIDALRVAHEEAVVALFRAEIALHEARQTRVDHWISAAADRLHEHVVAEQRTAAALRTGISRSG